MILFKGEIERNHGDVFQRIAERLGFISLYITEKIAYNGFRKSDGRNNEPYTEARNLYSGRVPRVGEM